MHCSPMHLSVAPRSVFTVPAGSVAFIIAVTDPNTKPQTWGNCTMFAQHYIVKESGKHLSTPTKKQIRNYLDFALGSPMQKSIYANKTAAINTWLDTLA